jgi:hypothetical protein
MAQKTAVSLLVLVAAGIGFMFATRVERTAYAAAEHIQSALRSHTRRNTRRQYWRDSRRLPEGYQDRRLLAVGERKQRRACPRGGETFSLRIA